MRFLSLFCLFILSINLQAHSYRYTESIFNEVSITENVVYANAPSLNSLYNDESNTTNTNLLMDIYPNPVRDMLVINDLPDHTTIQVFSVKGRLVKSIISEGTQMEVDVKELPLGLYIFNFLRGQRALQFRVLKTKL